MKRTFEERLIIVRKAKKGIPVAHLSREHKLNESKILEWVRKFDLYGEEGLKKQPNIKATPEFKREIVRKILEKGLTLAQIVVEYRISRTALESWVRTVRKYGYEALISKTRGRPPKYNMARPKKKVPQTELELLQEENLRLRAEVALLKKVKALVREEKAQAQRNGQQPSKN